MSVLLIDRYGDRIKYGRNAFAKIKLQFLSEKIALGTGPLDIAARRAMLFWLVWT